MNSPNGSSKKRSRKSATDGHLGLVIETTTSTTTTNESATTTAAAETTVCPPSRLLQQLANSCNEHHAHHNRMSSSSTTTHQQHQQLEEQEDAVPAFCHNALTILRKLLPRVEKQYRPADGGGGGGQHPGPSPLDVRHICDFYGNVIAGGFCVHAPHLFRLGKGASEVLPRVFYLIQHAISKSVMNHSIVELRQQQQRKTQQSCVISTISKTLARLLNLVPGVRLEMAIVMDLIQMIQDLCFLQESFPDNISSIQMALFPLTLAESDLEDKADCLVDLASHAATVSVLQSCLVATLQHFLILRRNQRLSMADDCTKLFPGGYEPSDLYLAGLIDDPETIGDLVCSLRQIILTPVEYPVEEALVLHSQRTVLAALKISDLVIADCHSGLFPEYVEAHLGLMAIQAAWLQLTAETTNTIMHGYSIHLDITMCLAGLIRRVFLGAVVDSKKAVSWSLHHSAFPIFMDCICSMYPSQQNSQNAKLKCRELSIALTESLATSLGYKQGVESIVPFPYPLNASNNYQCICRNIFLAMEDPDLFRFAFPFVMSVIKTNQPYYSEWVYGIAFLGNQTAEDLTDSSSKLNDEDTTVGSILKRKCSDINEDSIQDNTDCSYNRRKQQKFDHHGNRSNPFEDSLFDFLSKAVHIISTKNTPGKERSDSDSNTWVITSTAFSVLAYFLKDGKASSSDTKLIASVDGLIRYHSSWIEKSNEPQIQKIVSFLLRSAREIDASAPSLPEQVRYSIRTLISSCVVGLACDRKTAVLPAQVYDMVVASAHAKSPGGQNFRLQIIKKRLGLPAAATALETIKSAAMADTDDISRAMGWESVSFILQGWDDQSGLHRFIRSPMMSTGEKAPSISPILFLLNSAFGDKDKRTRDRASREIGRALVAGTPPSVLASFATDEELSHLLNKQIGYSAERIKAIHDSCFRFFQTVDKLLHEMCSVPLSQLSETSISGDDGNPDQISPEQTLLNKLAGIRALVSLCEACDVATESGKLIFERALLRVVRLWASSDELHMFETPGLCFGEAVRLFGNLNNHTMMRTRLLHFCSPSLFRDTLLPDGRDEIGGEAIDRQYRVMFNLLQQFGSSQWGDDLDPSDHIVLASSDAIVSHALDDCLPYVLAQLILEKEYRALCLTAGFKLFLLAQKQLDSKADTRAHSVLPHLIKGDRLIRGQSTKRPWTKDLEDHLYQVAQSPGVVEQMLPLVFQRAERPDLVFLSKDVLKNKRSLIQMMSAREQLMLKGFVKELGRNLNPARPLRALALGAVVQADPSAEILSGYDQTSNEAASQWISSRFMYLLVNVVQARWGAKATWEKIEDMRSLLHVLKFLRSSDNTVGQYLPQIMTTINGAISPQECEANSLLEEAELRLLGVQCMSTFIQLASDANWESIGENLASIIVSLLPVLGEDEKEGGNPALQEIRQHTQTCAVSIVGFLSKGELGDKLVPSFTSISFLLHLPALNKVKKSLQRHGVDCEALHELDATPGDLASKEGIHNDSESLSSDGKIKQYILAKQLLLRQRLDAISGLLSHENKNVRLVVLKHLSALLRGSRETFHALVENENNTSTNCFLTVPYGGKTRTSRGTVTELIESLLSQSAHETDHAQRLLLASTLGEVGAIAEYKLNDIVMPSGPEDFTGDDSHVWRLARPPWKVQPEIYGLRLVKDDLVRSLRAAPSSSDGLKIGYAIQQLLGFLQGDSSKETPMAGWLSKELSDAGVLEVVEPFLQSEFHEQHDGSAQRQPPFFGTCPSYLSWISNWCRYMVTRSQASGNNRWGKIFYACRTALRTSASGVAEFLLPILVLDRLCFGNGVDEQNVVVEMVDALTMKESDLSMKGGDLQKGVNAVFTIIDTFQYWLENDVEDRYRRSGRPKKDVSSSEWSQDEATMRIEDLLAKVPYELQAKAAAKVGMNARSLRLFEFASRQKVADNVFGISIGDQGATLHFQSNRSIAAGFCPADCLDPMKSVLSSLEDYGTLMSLTGASAERQLSGKVADGIREKVALQDWSGALQEHERGLWLVNDADAKFSHQQGILQCLLELGQHESVLNQVQGIVTAEDDSSYSTRLASYAVQAAWRLGRWDTLSSILGGTDAEDVADLDGKYHVNLGNSILAVEKKDPVAMLQHVKDARCAVMEQLAIASRDSYSRSYEQIVRLRSLQEVEDFARTLANGNTSYPLLGIEVVDDWNRRLESAAPDSAVTLINVRLALARLAGDHALEGKLFLDVGRRARKSWKHNAAATAFSRAGEAFDVARSRIEITDASSLQLELAKLKHQMGESSAALSLLDLGKIETMSQLDPAEARTESIRRVATALGVSESNLEAESAVHVFVRSALKSIKWTIEGGLKGGHEILNGLRVIHRLAPKWEKGHFRFAKYVEDVMKSRVTLLQQRASPNPGTMGDVDSWDQTLSNDKTCQKYLVLAVKHYAEALTLDLKHLYQALPRLLSLWFQFTSLTDDLLATAQADNSQAVVDERTRQDMAKNLRDSQMQVNELMATNFRAIPAQAFYSAIAQLVSRITHGNPDTQIIVQKILHRVLTKFPEQTMWHLAWLLHAKDGARRKIGVDIFKGAQKSLEQTDMCVLLDAAPRLFRYLHDLARYEVKDMRKTEVSVRSWEDKVHKVPLSAFVPPVQAALSLSHSQYSYVRSSTVFPRQIPRMRTFCGKISLMASKARPKRVKAYAMREDDPWATSDSSTQSVTTDIGEMHFLFKQEAKGDLRKDARVQDLNNVINRLMMSSSNSKQTIRSRRGLRLRTFAVTCLSEETGILEWVPNTSSLRSLVMESYNPHAPPSSSKRRGKRMANPGDPAIKQSFEKTCQNMYFQSGDLRRAGQMFEELCLGPHPPLLYWWFVRNFPNPHMWYEARTRFTQSAASWSAIGHVIGLGDRHAENILVDTTSGEIVHVDFDCIFDKGLNLPKPEVVPFRLTANMIDAFGPTGADGIYTGSLKDAMSTLRNNRDTLLSVLEPFLNDPVIDWKRSRTQQQEKNVRNKEQDRQFKEAKRSINVIDERLRGIYNLRNPNFKKIRRTDSYTAEQDDEELTQVMPLSVEGQVHKLIAEATSPENLVQLYVGWMPWV